MFGVSIGDRDMGWSEYVVRPEVHRIFTKAKKKYRLTWVSAPYPQVRIQHEGRIRIVDARSILDMFPDFVYVGFEPDVVFPESDPGDSFDYKD